MESNQQEELYISLIQRELAVLNKKIAKLTAINRQLINKSEQAHEKRGESAFCISIDSLNALLLILFAST